MSFLGISIRSFLDSIEQLSLIDLAACVLVRFVEAGRRLLENSAP